MTRHATSANAFIILCQQFSQTPIGCYSLNCSKCRDTIHIPWLKKLARGLHPNNTEWGNLEYTRNNGYLAFDAKFTTEELINIVEVVFEANLAKIHTTCRFPDWLGYLGWVVQVCSHYKPGIDRLSLSLLPQLNDLAGWVEDTPETLTIPVLEKYEEMISRRARSS